MVAQDVEVIALGVGDGGGDADDADAAATTTTTATTTSTRTRRRAVMKAGCRAVHDDGLVAVLFDGEDVPDALAARATKECVDALTFARGESSAWMRELRDARDARRRRASESSSSTTTTTTSTTTATTATTAARWSTSATEFFEKTSRGSDVELALHAALAAIVPRLRGVGGDARASFELSGDCDGDDGDEVLKERRSPRERGRMGTSHGDGDDETADPDDPDVAASRAVVRRALCEAETSTPPLADRLRLDAAGRSFEDLKPGAIFSDRTPVATHATASHAKLVAFHCGVVGGVFDRVAAGEGEGVAGGMAEVIPCWVPTGVPTGVPSDDHRGWTRRFLLATSVDARNVMCLLLTPSSARDDDDAWTPSDADVAHAVAGARAALEKARDAIARVAAAEAARRAKASDERYRVAAFARDAARKLALAAGCDARDARDTRDARASRGGGGGGAGGGERGGGELGMVRPSGRRLASCAEVEFLVGGEGEGEGGAWIRARVDLDAGGRVA